MAASAETLQIFAEQLAHLIIMEQQSGKLYLKLEKVAFTPELSKALSPVSTDNEQHLQRLKLIKLSVKEQKVVKNDPTFEAIKATTKAAGNLQDLQIINNVLHLQNLKLARYEFLHPIAIALNMQNEAELLEQTITDHRNTNTWLRQIIQNIIVPGIA